jgi:glycosyltransferase involved in cell wall biosynthesis
MGVRLGLVSTYPPTACGIATFSAALTRHLFRQGAHVDVLRLVDRREPQVLPVVGQWVRDHGTAQDAALTLSDVDTVLLQHEYGIFGGADGEDVLDLVHELKPPVVTVLHTVLARPTPGQHAVMAGLLDRSAAVITMTATGRDRLVSGWDADPARVVVIPHGAEDHRGQLTAVATHRRSRPTVLTWGLLSEGKGIEWALLALAELARRGPVPQYRIVGRTHPRVLERDGDRYRDRLVALVDELGLGEHVRFVDRYLTQDELRREVDSADVVLLPYDSVEQVTSGVLSEAVAAGKPVVSTSFPHAVELLSGGAGIVVPHSDPDAIAAALLTLLDGTGTSLRMAQEARRIAPSLLWPRIADRYIALARSVTGLPTASSSAR